MSLVALMEKQVRQDNVVERAQDLEAKELGSSPS